MSSLSENRDKQEVLARLQDLGLPNPWLLADRFWPKVETPHHWGECWEWTAAKTKNGYGRFGVKSGVHIPAHRFAYELVIDSIPEGKQVDHLCRNRACVNPYHLEPVTQKENVLRGESFSAINAKKTHCPKGHPLSGPNLCKKKNGRQCRICFNEWWLQRYHRLKQQKVCEGHNLKVGVIA